MSYQTRKDNKFNELQVINSFSLNSLFVQSIELAHLLPGLHSLEMMKWQCYTAKEEMAEKGSAS